MSSLRLEVIFDGVARLTRTWPFVGGGPELLTTRAVCPAPVLVYVFRKERAYSRSEKPYNTASCRLKAFQ
jgi:hypothetical protein